MTQIPHAGTRVFSVAAIAAAALLASGASASGAADEFHASVAVNGVLKAYGEYFPRANTMCIDLSNAPNPGAGASVEILHSSGYLIDFTSDDTNNGTRVCRTLSPPLVQSYDGQPAKLRVTFCPASGACRAEATVIKI